MLRIEDRDPTESGVIIGLDRIVDVVGDAGAQYRWWVLPEDLLGTWQWREPSPRIAPLWYGQEREHVVDWDTVRELARHPIQCVWAVFIAFRDGDAVPTRDREPSEADIRFEAFDCSFWLFHARDPALLARVRASFERVFDEDEVVGPGGPA